MFDTKSMSKTLHLKFHNGTLSQSSVCGFFQSDAPAKQHHNSSLHLRELGSKIMWLAQLDGESQYVRHKEFLKQDKMFNGSNKSTFASSLILRASSFGTWAKAWRPLHTARYGVLCRLYRNIYIWSPLQTYVFILVLIRDVADRLFHFAESHFQHFNRNVSIHRAIIIK